MWSLTLDAASDASHGINGHCLWRMGTRDPLFTWGQPGGHLALASTITCGSPCVLSDHPSINRETGAGAALERIMEPPCLRLWALARNSLQYSDSRHEMLDHVWQPRHYRAASSSLRGNSYTRQKGGKRGESEGGRNCFWQWKDMIMEL